MKTIVKIYRIFFINILIVCLVASCTIVDSNTMLQNNNISTVINTLTSSDLQGRLTGTEGNKRAQEFLIDAFHQIGLDYYIKNSYAYDYKHSYIDTNLEASTLKLKLNNDQYVELQCGKDYFPSNNFKQLNIESEIVMNLEGKNYADKYIIIEKKEDIKNKITKAAGILIVTDHFKKSLSINEAGTPIIQISKKVYGDIKNSKQASISYKNETNQEEMQASNIIGKITGRTSKNVLVLSAHFDHVGCIGEKPVPGATDNASGVSVLIDIARKLKQYSLENTIDQDIIICAFNGEESGLQGSRAFIESIKNEYENIYNINIDSLSSRENGIVIAGDEHSSSLLAEDIKLFLQNKGFDSEIADTSYTSDYISFLENDIPAVNIGQKHAEKLHTTEDIKHLIDYQYLKDLSNTIFEFIVSNIDKAIYNHNHDNEVNNDLTDEERAEIKFRDEERDKLAINEYKLVHFQGRDILITKPVVLYKNPEDISKDFPQIKSVPQIVGYNFTRSIIATKFDNSIDKKNLELNKLYKRPLTISDIYHMSLSYSENETKDFLTLYFAIFNKSSESFTEDQEEYYQNLKGQYTLTSEIVTLGNQNYNMIFSKENEAILSCYNKHDIEDKVIYVQIRKAKYHSTGSSTVIDTTKEASKESLKLLNDMGIDLAIDEILELYR